MQAPFADLDYLRERARAMTDRTDKDYAIEHAGYMVTTARRLLAAIADEDFAREHRLSSLRNDEEYHRRVEARIEATKALRCDMYEFEKRRDRALGSHRKPPPVGHRQIDP